MIPKCKECPAKEKKGDKYTNDHNSEDTSGMRGVQTKGLSKFRVSEDHIQGRDMGVRSPGG